ncbi:MAG: copper chaperone PCu(A)C [Magnetovibrio sp.]|nr:copper chaperone PCu(A)C [Magnetovibrio sp.]
MKRFAFAMIACGLLAGFPADAGHKKHAASAGNLELTRAWARATPPRARNGAGYLTITNHGDDADRLIGASAPVAQRAELHTHLMEGGVMKMREIAGGIEIPAGATVALEPGGRHVMMMGLHKALKDGAMFPLTLVFAKGGQLTIPVHVKKTAPAKHGHGQPHGHKTGAMPK